MAELHGETGYISGQVTSAASGEAIAGADACATVANGNGSWRCATTDVGGNYTIAVDGGGAYEVRFWAPSGSADLSNVYYDGKRSPAGSRHRLGAIRPHHLGHRRPAGRGRTYRRHRHERRHQDSARRCRSLRASSDSGCVLTNAKGEYVISELQEGEYKVEFSVADGAYHSQYWDGKQSIGEGQLVPVAAGQAAAGVNAELEATGR